MASIVLQRKIIIMSNKLKRAERKRAQAAQQQAKKESQMRKPSGKSSYAMKKKLNGGEPGWIGNDK